ncbi:4-hydroxybenzoate 3-monooxygenase [Sphaerisporangium siamense]|uniref:p-hydroxybenzoate 3-monooxygenase n=1 Tax=Sphaerisporangium siamense TaxID=795645 RepID=A0A7W7DBH3_9ACTN|nr:4-hydroxybenzoate 3-monooxygenase [Sphaerisporangium siamense]MBB4703784.1 p-hydroxybenzoate 3-monooxygenase [Sphaerisporangium siamense]GII82253.1 4-hydroxybenzoate 3-monooxygenase [Sphaerisporangium siamense]
MVGGRESTAVVIVGAGPAGLTLGNLLLRAGVECVVLERRGRAYVEERQRAGVLDHAGAQIFEEWGLADGVLAGVPGDGGLEIRVDGEPRFLDFAELSGGRTGRLIPQQMLVRRLIGSFEEGGGDLRFDAAEVALHGLDGDAPWVSYRDAEGVVREIGCVYVAGCDGHHGVSRASVPAGALTTYSHDHGIGWLTVLADVPPPRRPLMAVASEGFAAHFPRGPMASRFYLQCAPEDGVGDWGEERIWAQLRARLGDSGLPAGRITEMAVVEMRSFVVDPMRFGRLFLVGDAAHIVTPMGGKGMNLAIGDADVLARALRAAVREGDGEGLAAYSAVCLRRVWNYQEFSRWLTEMTHDAGDVRVAGEFRRQLARARLDRLFSSGVAARAFADLVAGG